MKDIGEKPLKHRDEFSSHMLEGIFVKPSFGDPQFLYRVATMGADHFWEVVENVRDDKDRLREEEPADIFKELSDQHQAGKYKDAVPLFSPSEVCYATPCK